MPSVQSRVAQVEEKLREHEAIIAELRAGTAEMRNLREQMDRRFERMDHKIDRHFMWTIALLASMLVAAVRSFYQYSEQRHRNPNAQLRTTNPEP